MASSLDDLIAQLSSKSGAGMTMQEQSVLTALQMNEVRAKIQSMLDAGHALVSASPLASPRANVSRVLFQFGPPPGSASLGIPAVLAEFDRGSNKLVSLSDDVRITETATSFGPAPFALATPSFSRAAATPGNDPALVARNARRASFEGKQQDGPGALARSSSGTSVGCYQDTPYGTSESYDTNGTTDWHTVTDHSQDWVIDDITNDDA